MSVKELEKQVRALPRKQLQRFGQWFDAYRQEAPPTSDVDDDWQDDLSDERRAEILSRAEVARTRPELIEPWEGTTDRVRKRLHEIRAQKTATRRSR